MKSGSGGTGFQPRWEHFSRLGFLSDSCIAEESTSNISLVETPLLEENIQTPEDLYFSADTAESASVLTDDSIINSPLNVCKERIPTRIKKRKRQEALTELTTCLKSLNEAKEDAEEAFGHYIAVELKSMDESKHVVVNQSNVLRGNLPANLSQQTCPHGIAANTSPGPAPSTGANPLTVQLGQHQSFGLTSQPLSQQLMSMTSNIQLQLAHATTVNQMAAPHSQAMTTSPASNMSMQQSGMSMNTPQPTQPQVSPSVARKYECTIWQGNLVFEGRAMPSSQPQPQKVLHSLPCTFSSMVTNGDPDVNADKWPNRLMLQLVPRQLIMVANLSNILKTAARHVLIHFNQDSEALSTLCNLMSSGLVGCIQYPQTCLIRIMVVLYVPDKKIYLGFIANDQDTFLHNIRQMFETHRKQQQKQRLQHQQQQLDQATAQQRHQQQMAQVTAQQQQSLQMYQVNATNSPQLRSLLQQQAQQQMRQQQSMQAMMQQQSMRPQGIVTQQQQQSQEPPPQSWDNSGVLDLLQL